MLRRRWRRHCSTGDRGIAMATTTQQQQQPFRSTIPARLDRIRWSPFHTRLVLGLGTAWVLDGLPVTIASSVTSKLTQPGTLDLTTVEAASIGTVYLIGEVFGALVFGKLSDRLGRRKLFVWTMAIYLVGTGLTALTPKGASWVFYLFATRVIAGLGIGGEYSAINSAIDEMMPARYRGRTDVWINGSYWLGAIIGTFATFLILGSFRTSLGWRLTFLVGPALAFVIIFVRRNLPERPRWLITHGRVQEAEEAIRGIEDEASRAGQHLEPVPYSAAVFIRPEKRFGYLTLLRVALRQCPRRATLGGTLRPDVRGRQPGRPAVAWPFVRHPRAQEDDLRYVPDLWGTARVQRLAVRLWSPVRYGPGLHLDRRLLLRLGRGQRRLPHGQRNLPDRDQGRGTCGVLRHSHGRRGRRAGLLRRADR
jgi:hypothetical protein